MLEGAAERCGVTCGVTPEGWPLWYGQHPTTDSRGGAVCVCGRVACARDRLGGGGEDYHRAPRRAPQHSTSSLAAVAIHRSESIVPQPMEPRSTDPCDQPRSHLAFLHDPFACAPTHAAARGVRLRRRAVHRRARRRRRAQPAVGRLRDATRGVRSHGGAGGCEQRACEAIGGVCEMSARHVEKRTRGGRKTNGARVRPTSPNAHNAARSASRPHRLVVRASVPLTALAR